MQFAAFKIKGNNLLMRVTDQFIDNVKRITPYYNELIRNTELAYDVLENRNLNLEEQSYVAAAMKIMEAIDFSEEELYSVLFFIKHAEDFNGFYKEEDMGSIDHILI